MILIKGRMTVRMFLVALTCLVLGGALFALGYWQGQRSMQQKIDAALAAQKVASARENNFARFAPGQPMPPLSSMARSYPGQAMSPMVRPTLPPNATPEMKEFYQNRTTLMEKMAELRKQNPNNTNGPPDQSIIAQFQQENAALLARQRELAQVIGQQQAKNPMPEPPPLQIPPNASPQMKDYLTARDQLMRDQIAFMNQHRTDESSARQAAMEQWRQQNTARFQQLQQQSQALAQNSQPTPQSTTQTTSTTPVGTTQ